MGSVEVIIDVLRELSRVVKISRHSWPTVCMTLVGVVGTRESIARRWLLTFELFLLFVHERWRASRTHWRGRLLGILGLYVGVERIVHPEDGDCRSACDGIPRRELARRPVGHGSCEWGRDAKVQFGTACMGRVQEGVGRGPLNVDMARGTVSGALGGEMTRAERWRRCRNARL